MGSKQRRQRVRGDEQGAADKNWRTPCRPDRQCPVHPLRLLEWQPLMDEDGVSHLGIRYRFALPGTSG